MKNLIRLTLVIAFLFACVESGLAQSPSPTPSPTPTAKRKFKHNGRFITRYDKFKDQTSVILAPFPVTGTMRYVIVL